MKTKHILLSMALLLALSACGGSDTDQNTQTQNNEAQNTKPQNNKPEDNQSQNNKPQVNEPENTKPHEPNQTTPTPPNDTNSQSQETQKEIEFEDVSSSIKRDILTYIEAKKTCELQGKRLPSKKELENVDNDLALQMQHDDHTPFWTSTLDKNDKNYVYVAEFDKNNNINWNLFLTDFQGDVALALCVKYK